MNNKITVLYCYVIGAIAEAFMTGRFDYER